MGGISKWLSGQIPFSKVGVWFFIVCQYVRKSGKNRSVSHYDKRRQQTMKTRFLRSDNKKSLSKHKGKGCLWSIMKSHGQSNLVGIALRYDVSFSLKVPHLFPLKSISLSYARLKALFIDLFIKALFTDDRNALFIGVARVL